MLLDPLKKQLNLPAALMDLGDRMRRKRHLVREITVMFLLLGIVVFHPPKLVWIRFPVVNTEIVIFVEVAGGVDEGLREVCIDAPVARFIRFYLKFFFGYKSRLQLIVFFATSSYIEYRDSHNRSTVPISLYISFLPRNVAICCDQERSNRSRFITLFHTATKSCTNFSSESSHP